MFLLLLKRVLAVKTIPKNLFLTNTQNINNIGYINDITIKKVILLDDDDYLKIAFISLCGHLNMSGEGK